MSFEIFGNSLSFKIGKLFGGILNKKLFKNKVFLSTEDIVSLHLSIELGTALV